MTKAAKALDTSRIEIFWLTPPLTFAWALCCGGFMCVYYYLQTYNLVNLFSFSFMSFLWRSSILWKEPYSIIYFSYSWLIFLVWIGQCLFSRILTTNNELVYAHKNTKRRLFLPTSSIIHRLWNSSEQELWL